MVTQGCMAHKLWPVITSSFDIFLWVKQICQLLSGPQPEARPFMPGEYSIAWGSIHSYELILQKGAVMSHGWHNVFIQSQKSLQ